MNPITLADVLTGRVPLYIHQLAQQQVGRHPQMQPTRPAQSDGLLPSLGQASTKDAVDAGVAGKSLRPGRQSLHQSVEGALDKAYGGRSQTAGRKDPVHKALTQAHDALGLPRPPRTVAHDSFGKKF
jgi:hypothetical protein